MSTATQQSAALIVALAVELVKKQQVVPSRLEMAQKIEIPLDPWQEAVLTSHAKRMLLNVTRQGGKSTISALLGLHTALYKRDSLVLIVSPGERQSKLLFKKLMFFYRKLGKPVASKLENVLSLELVNGSEIYALPGTEGTIRGFSAVNLLISDEASRIPDAMMAAVNPMLAISGGRHVAMSTPFGKRGWWYQAWVDGGDDWERFEVPATMCPRITPEFLESERRALPKIWFDSEYMCQFVEPDDAVFSYEAIARAFDDDIPMLFPIGIESDVA